MDSPDDPTLAPFRLKPWFSPRPWGRASLEPWYSAAQTGTSEPIGEAWLTGPQSIAETGPLAGQALASIAASHPAQLLGVPDQSNGAPAWSVQPAEFPLLIKLLFPADKLSVQVHPDDAHAQAMGQPRGKTECWYVLEAEHGAQIALGLQSGATSDSVRAAIAAGTLEDLMQWVPVTQGDMFFVDAGTVHAIGPGMVLLETQQTSDITFRMYDYGRARELHVDQALRVMKTRTNARKTEPHAIDGRIRLIEERYFLVDRYDLPAKGEASVAGGSPMCLVGLHGTAQVESVAGERAGEAVELRPGQAVVVPVSAGRVRVRSEAAAGFVVCRAR